MDWMKKHADTVMVLGSLFGMFIWMNGQFHGIDMDLRELDKRLTRIETIMIIKNIMPNDMISECKKIDEDLCYN